MIIKNGLVYTKDFSFEAMTVCTEKDTITNLSTDASEVSVSEEDTVFDASGCYVLPGSRL